MPVKQKKKVRDEKNQTLQYEQNKIANFLTNILYNGVKEEDLFDRSFVFDVNILTTKNINPFSLERKIFDVKNREMVHMF